MAIALLISRWLTALAALTLGCREPTPKASVPTPVVIAPVESPPPAQPVSSGTPDGTIAKSKPPERDLSEDEMVTVLIDSKFPAATPEGAKDRLAPLGNVRERRPVDTTAYSGAT